MKKVYYYDEKKSINGKEATEVTVTSKISEFELKGAGKSCTMLYTDFGFPMINTKEKVFSEIGKKAVEMIGDDDKIICLCYDALEERMAANIVNSNYLKFEAE